MFVAHIPIYSLLCNYVQKINYPINNKLIFEENVRAYDRVYEG